MPYFVAVTLVTHAGTGRVASASYLREACSPTAPREEFAGDTEFHDTSKTYSHLMSGQCRCGTRHGDAAKLGDSDGHRNLVATYDYYLLNGELPHQTLRYEPKDFSQRRPDGQGGWVYKNVFKDFEPVLYRLPEVYEAIRKGEPVLLCEGEKDADRGAGNLGSAPPPARWVPRSGAPPTPRYCAALTL